MASPDRARVKAIFARVTEAPPAARAGLVDELCAGDLALRERVLELLGSDERAGDAGFLGAPALDGAREVAARSLEAGSPEPAGRVGRYEIVAKLGEGGMGAVYEARQDVPSRAVALKLISGPATPSRRRRLRHEADVLGRLEHPGIARVYDAGVAPVTFSDGSSAALPFIAMELVRGESLLEYAGAHGLGDRARIELLAEIAEAAHSAHQKGVIHRDLKPANVLVTPEGRPKILDFGVARLVSDKDGGAETRTVERQIVGTLAYMSPEQVGGDHRLIDTRTDVYALGVIGYELLSGRTPLELGSTSFMQAARMIAEQPAPSLGVAAPRLRGDVATIIDTALAKSPDERYRSAAELAADLRRLLRDEPIAAHPPSAVYVLRKFASRNKALVGVSAAAALALVAAMIAAIVLAVQANQARKAAELEALRSAAAASFMRQMLSGVKPAVARRLDTALLKRILDDTAGRLDAGELAGHPGVEAELRVAIGKTYLAIAAYDDAIAMLERAVALYEVESGPLDDLTLAARHDLASMLTSAGRFQEAERALLALRGDMRASKASSPALDADVAVTTGALYDHLGRHEEAVPQLERAVQGCRRVYGRDAGPTIAAENSLAGAYSEIGRLGEAIELYERVVTAYRRVAGDDHPNTAQALNNLAMAYKRAGRLAEADPLLREAIEVQRSVYRGDHPTLGMTTHSLATVYLELGRIEDAELAMREALRMFESTTPGHWFVAEARAGVGECMAARGDYAAAAATMAQAYEEYVAAIGADSARTKDLARRVASLFAAWNEKEPSPSRVEERDRWRTRSQD